MKCCLSINCCQRPHDYTARSAIADRILGLPKNWQKVHLNIAILPKNVCMIASLIALKFLMFSNPKKISVNYLFQESKEYEIINKTSDRQYFFSSLIDDVEKKVDEEKAKTEFVDDDIEEIISRNRWNFFLVIPVFIWIIYKSLSASNDD